jgi:hypothetical protein
MPIDKLLAEIRTLEIKIEAQSRRKKAAEQRHERAEHLERQLDRLEEAKLKLEKRRMQLEFDADYGLKDDDDEREIEARITSIDAKAVSLRGEIEALRKVEPDENDALKGQLRRNLVEAARLLAGANRAVDELRVQTRLGDLVRERRVGIERAAELLRESRNHLLRAAADLEVLQQSLVNAPTADSKAADADVGVGPRQRTALLVRAGARAFREAWETLADLSGAWDDVRLLAMEKQWLTVPFEVVADDIEPAVGGPRTEPGSASALPARLEVASRELTAVTLWVNELRTRVASLPAEPVAA